MKLHLGCGHNYLEGWINIDGPKNLLCYDDLKADIYTRIEDLTYPDDSVDEILMEAVFEHFPHPIACTAWRSWLKPRRILHIAVPDIHHREGWTINRLTKMLTRTEFEIVSIKKNFWQAIYGFEATAKKLMDAYNRQVKICGPNKIFFKINVNNR